MDGLPGSKPFSIDIDDVKSLGWSVLDVSIAASITWLAELRPEDALTIALVGVLTVVAKAARKYVADNSKRWTQIR
jgi:hypothetical protein